METSHILEKNTEKLEEELQESLSFEEYLEKVEDNPRYGQDSANYLLDAIESLGTRKVIEEGEEKERYVFFDDFYNNGENAVLGNTDELNAIVDDIRTMAEGKRTMDKMLWVVGPTASGKSELKRCLVNGLEAYSKTEEGKRYTLAWRNGGEEPMDQIGFLNDSELNKEKGEWEKSPVQDNPLKLLYKDIREEFEEEIEEKTDHRLSIDGELSPFDREYLEEKGKTGYRDLFRKAKDLKVVNYTVKKGNGIGVLQTEDEGTPKQKMVGNYQKDIQKIKKHGINDPRLFNYQGVLSQGNNGLTVFEDMIKHQDVLTKLMNIPEERQVDIGKHSMDIDTVMMVISNPDLEFKLGQNEEMEDQDPYRALKRRMKKHEFRYLTSYSDEAKLLERELSSDYRSTDQLGNDKDIQKPLKIDSGDEEIEIAPHGIETAALYDVVTRLEDDMEPKESKDRDFSILDKAMLFEQGYLKDGFSRLKKEDFNFIVDDDGKTGVPVTYTREKILEKVDQKADKEGEVIMPSEILDALSNLENLSKSPVSGKEAERYSKLDTEVRKYLLKEQERDLLDSILDGLKPSDEEIVEYVNHVSEWIEEGDDYDQHFMKTFEKEGLGIFREGSYEGTEPGEGVESFRKTQIYDGIRKVAMDKKDNFEFERDVKEIPILREVAVEPDWSSVFRNWENFKPESWKNPSGGTDTEEVRQKAVRKMVEKFGYSEESAVKTSANVIENLEFSGEQAKIVLEED